jgi:hypothetical protein
MSRANERVLVPVERIEPRILLIRGQRVILDADLADLYGTATKRLNEQVKRNRGRFPDDFAWQLTRDEKTEVVANCDHLARLKFTRNLPYAFTEYGALMAASVLNSPRAIDTSVYVIRAFVKLREWLSTHKEFAKKLAESERKVSSHDEAIQSLVAAIRHLTQPQPRPRPRIGFHVKPGT